MRIRSLGVLGVLCLAAFTCGAQDASGPPRQHAGILKTVRGDVQLIGEPGGSRPARPGDSVTAADRLIIDSPTPTGLIVLKALAAEPGLMPQAQATLVAAQCGAPAEPPGKTGTGKR